MKKLFAILMSVLMIACFMPTMAFADGETAKGTEQNPYTLTELGKMDRQAYIEAQTRLGGTMYVAVDKYEYSTNGTLGNGERNDTPGQTPDHSKLNAYAENGYLSPKGADGKGNDGANGKNYVETVEISHSDVSGITTKAPCEAAFMGERHVCIEISDFVMRTFILAVSLQM